MFFLLESRSEIAKANAKLEATFRREFRRRATKDIGYPGGRFRNARVYNRHNASNSCVLEVGGSRFFHPRCELGTIRGDRRRAGMVTALR